jgi:hypothetical protein
MDWLVLVSFALVGSFFFLFVFSHAVSLAFFWRKRRSRAMSRWRLAWSLLGGLSMILVGCFGTAVEWRDAQSRGDLIASFAVALLFLAAGALEIDGALRAAFASKHA